MDNKRYVDNATKKLAESQPQFINKSKLLHELSMKLKGLDKAKNYSRYRAIQECIALIEDFKE